MTEAMVAATKSLAIQEMGDSTRATGQPNDITVR
jgi:hypothetical protein